MVIKLLIHTGGSVEAVNRFRQTPLHIAAWSRKGREACAELLRCGANPLARDSAGVLPWQGAESRGIEDDVVELLREAARGAAAAAGDPSLADDRRTGRHGRSGRRRRNHHST